MHISMLGTRGVPARYGGFETAVEEIGRRLVAQGHRITVYCRGESHPREFMGMRRVNLPYLPTSSAETLSHSLLSAVHLVATGADACIVFNAANVPVVPIIKRRGIPVAVHVDGLEWQRGKWGRRGQGYYQWAEARAVQWADALISDAVGIQDYYIEKFGAESVFIPYGAPRVDEPQLEKLDQMGLTPGKFHLVVARMEPENHLELILEGYRASRAALPLIVVGSVPRPTKYQSQIIEMAARDSRVSLVGSVWDQGLLDTLYTTAALYIHGHSVGGTNPSLLRAMGAGARTTAIDVVFNREVLGDTGTFFTSPGELAAAIESTESDLPAAVEIGKRSRDRATRLYDWDVVADQYLELCMELAATRVAQRKTGWRRSRSTSAGVEQKAGREAVSDTISLDAPAGVMAMRGEVSASELRGS